MLPMQEYTPFDVFDVSKMVESSIVSLALSSVLVRSYMKRSANIQMEASMSLFEFHLLQKYNLRYMALSNNHSKVY